MKNWVKDHQKEGPSSWEAGKPEAPKKQGRPEVPEAKKRKPRFTMNLNDEEFALVVEAAEQDGLTQASFARLAVLAQARKSINR